MILKENDFDYLSYVEYGNTIDLNDLRIAKLESINKLSKYCKRKKALDRFPELGFIKNIKRENDFAYKFWATNVCYQIFRKLSEELPGFINPLIDDQCKPNIMYVKLLNDILYIEKENTFIKEIIEYNGKLLFIYSDKTIYSQDALFQECDIYNWGSRYFKVLNKVFQTLRIDQSFNMSDKSFVYPNGAKVYLYVENGPCPLANEYFTLLIVSDKMPIKMVQANLLGYIREIKEFSCLSKSEERKRTEEIKRERVKEKYKFNK